MSIASRVFLQRVSEARARAHHLKFIDLTPVKKVKFSFDPFREKVRSVRDMSFQLTTSHRQQTNIKCAFKYDVKCDRSEPLMEVQFEDGHKLLYKTENLTTVEILKSFNEECKKRRKDK